MVEMLRDFRRLKMVGTAKKAGVTLIELLIVVLILAVLATIAIPRISQSAQNAKLGCSGDIQHGALSLRRLLRKASLCSVDVPSETKTIVPSVGHWFGK